MHAERPLNLPLRTLDDANPAVAAVLAKGKKGTGMVPNMYGIMANAPGVLDTYLHGYDQLRRGSSFDATELQVVLLAISRFNGCTYCVAAHSALSDLAGTDSEVTGAIREGSPVPNEKLNALATFTTRMVETRGLPTAADLDAFLAAGYTETDVLQIVLAIAVKTISNYSNHLLHTPVDDAFSYRAWEG